MSTKARPYWGGLPTEPDVKKLLAALGTPAPGLIPHERLEEITGHERGDGRYRTVVSAWRSRLLRESNLATRAEPNEGIRILTEPERVEESGRMLRKSARFVIRQHRWNLMIDVSKLSDLERHKLDVTRRFSDALAKAAASNIRELGAALKPPAQLPRPEIS